MIRPLPKHVANQIAAGEVVERPASIVKELVENSLDAGASEIRVNIVDFGTSKIQVIDNGIGIAKSDFIHLFKKHSTSKIRDISDLESINSFGFRGEALASISSVSKITLQTKHKDDEIGSEILIDFGQKSEIKPSAIDSGSNFIVENLFENIPARKKFLKTKTTENKAILDILYKFILSNPHVDFHINIDGITKSFVKSSLKLRISSVLKVDENDLIEIDSDGKIKVSGFLIHPRIFLKNRSNQFIFVNKRPVNDPTVGKAIIDGFDTFLMKHQYPGYVIFVDIPPSELDVNVHPRKTEVRFHNSSEVYKTVRFVVNQRLTSNMRDETKSKFIELNENRDQIQSFHSKVREFESFLRDGNDISKSKNVENPKWLTKKALEFNKEILDESLAHIIKEPEITLDKANNNNSEPKFIVDFENATQLLNSYIITANRDNILIIDQHAASERFFYEKYLKQLKSKKVESKVLLVPEIINFDELEIEQLLKSERVLNNFGFEVEQFGNDRLKILQVPNFVKMDNFQKVFHLIANEIIENSERENLESVIYHDIAAILACHTAVRFGDKLTKTEIITILKNLMACDDPYNCPHGRPIIQEFSIYQIEKKFKRCSI